MSKRKEDKTLYTVTITGEQIKTIRSIYLRIETVYVHRGVAEIIGESGKVERVPLYECHFCHQGSYESIAAIPHTRDCIIPLADKEFDALNAQFIQVLDR